MFPSFLDCMQIKILALCGSSRRTSLNQKLLDTAVLGALEAGAQVSKIRVLDFPLPRRRLGS
jgi:chromate reductase